MEIKITKEQLESIIRNSFMSGVCNQAFTSSLPMDEWKQKQDESLQHAIETYMIAPNK